MTKCTKCMKCIRKNQDLYYLNSLYTLEVYILII